MSKGRGVGCKSVIGSKVLTEKRKESDAHLKLFSKYMPMLVVCEFFGSIPKVMVWNRRCNGI